MTDRPAAPPSPWADWPLDREIVMARVVDADRHTAFRAWTDPDLIVQWFGPAGFRIDTREIDIRVGGVWRFDMIRPDGTLFSNRMTFLRIEAPWLIEFVRGTDSDDDPDAFRMLVTFDAQDNGKTAVTIRQNAPERSAPRHRGRLRGGRIWRADLGQVCPLRRQDIPRACRLKQAGLADGT